MLQEFTDQTVKELIVSGRPVMVDCWATWCSACVKLTPVIEQLAETYADSVAIGKCNIEDEVELPVDYNVRALPTLLFFKDGQLVDRLAGTHPREEIESKIKALLA